MAKKRGVNLSMRKIREILRLGLKCGCGARDVARSCGISHPTVKKYLSLARKARLSYEHVEGMDDNTLCGVLKKEAPAGAAFAKEARPMPDWLHIYSELKKKSVTLQLLWDEYKAVHQDGYQLSQFCEHFSRWKRKLNVSLRQTYKAGEKMFIDYAGQTVPVYDQVTGKEKQAQVFIAVLGASNYTYAEASWDQSLPNWIQAHVNTFECFGGVPEITVPDNLKSGISKACWYEPDINPTYHDLSVHYGTVVLPARIRKPKDKSKVEAGVLVVERWILAALRNRKFFSLHELNTAIKELLVKLNDRPFKKIPGSRRSSFESMEKSLLKPLPAEPYTFAQWKKARVNIDYHVELDRHYYSVPYNLVQEQVVLRYTNSVVEIFFKGNRIASHIRSDIKGRHTTISEHMPKTHREYSEWTPSRMINWGKKIGQSTAEIIEIMLNNKQYPALAYRACLGILRLGKIYSDIRLEAACKRAIYYRGYSYKSVRSILEAGLDAQSLPKSKDTIPIAHENIRGNEYFDTQNKQEVAVC